MTKPFATRVTVIAAVTLGVFILSGCSTPGMPNQGAATATPRAAGDQGEKSSVKGARITVPCDSLVKPTQLTAINPNLEPAPHYTPAKDSHAETIVGLDGLACEWRDRKTGQTVEVAVAHLPDAAITTLKNETITVSKPVPTYGAWPQIEGYFHKTDGVGIATVFRGPYWIESSSTAYFEPGDAQLMAEAVLEALPM